MKYLLSSQLSPNQNSSYSLIFMHGKRKFYILWYKNKKRNGNYVLKRNWFEKMKQ